MNKRIQTNYFLTALCLVASAYSCADNENTVVATINTGITPAGLAITCDHHYAYVANNNNYGISGQDSVSVLNLHHNKVSQIIYDDSFDGPYTVTINPKKPLAYVTNSVGTTITVIDIKTNQVINVIDGFNGPSGMVITPNGKYGYINNYGAGDMSGTGNTVSVIDLSTNTILGEITVGLAPAALAISPTGKYVYVVNYVDGNLGTGTMSIIKTGCNAVIATIDGGFSGPFDIAVTPSGDYAYVTNFGSNNFAPFGTTVSVVKLRHHHRYEIVDTINVGIQPAGVAIAPDGHHAYVTNYNTLYAGSDFTDLTAGQGTVNIINIKKNEVVSPTIAVGQSPANIAIASNGKHAYVTNFTSNVVDVIQLRD